MKHRKKLTGHHQHWNNYNLFIKENIFHFKRKKYDWLNWPANEEVQIEQEQVSETVFDSAVR